MRLKKKSRIIIKIFMAGCLLLAIYSLYNISIWYIENKENDSIKEEINQYVEIKEETKKGEDNEEEKEFKYIIDFSKLKEKNPDTVAYLKVEGTKIDYIIVKGTDNKYYLKHNFNKESNRSGWIFMDYHNKLDGTDKNIVIYGHNTRDGSMFGTLRNVVKKEWYQNENNYLFDLVLENEVATYQVFSTYSIKVEDYYINTIFKDNKEFDKFVKTLKKRSVYNYQVDVSGEDSILTLSTCTGDGTSRMVLHAKRLSNIEE